ncbi:hypothetical protein [Fluoribacter gormanii]|uniref:Uncharacterized protein n=1 Tax=Fluoribacter gormanii TaxID=464 RepID=A0A377GHS6_9GAMM|nr:hypothetical protein [Fluoribacter gormanii]KTD01311.1 hypothetical protein Lgor_2377 [Fluoribacter gormanii]MCW8444138.1 hypothetical protein [Fluoribacter gormanii]SIR81469.1 hypothetical protein SAMN05421777_12633 [Fluoribacter gormanii]STO24298.1 Uncharacterised protein [Fluoribacter gormanii]
MNDSSIAIDPDKLIPDNKQGMITDNGTFYRKGTSLATFDNVKKYQALIDSGVKDIAHPEIQTAINDQRFITNMMAVGLYFSFFPEADWLADEQQEGRMMPALLMLQQYPNKLSPELLKRLLHIKNKLNPITQTLIEETLDYYQNYLNKLEKTKKYISHLFMQYVHGLENQNITDIDALWLDKAESCLIVPSFDTPIKGKTNIINFTQKNFSNFTKLRFQVSNIEVNIDLIKGIAHLYALKTLKVELKEDNAFKGKPIPTKAVVNVEFIRMDVPSCLPVLKGFENWRLGNWKISNWTECFPYSQF